VGEVTIVAGELSGDAVPELAECNGSQCGFVRVGF
jgi:hypothetical protein